MACFHPLPAWFSKHVNNSGKRSIVFNMRDASSEKLEVPCGRCVGCRLERSRQWAMRLMHESKLHEDSSFVTLTYDDDHLVELPGAEEGAPSLDPRHMTLFLKRLRKSLDHPIRFFQCGEYGEKTHRPHHHALLFGYRPSDLKLWKQSGDHHTYISSTLESLWGKGFVSVGAVTFESASYVARYAMKKVYGPEAADWYQGRVPEYITMSRRPGIGRNFFDKYHQEIYNRDSCIVNAREVKPPKYYDNLMHDLEPETMLIIKDNRKLASAVNPNNKPARLRVRERTATHKLHKHNEARSI